MFSRSCTSGQAQSTADVWGQDLGCGVLRPERREKDPPAPPCQYWLRSKRGGQGPALLSGGHSLGAPGRTRALWRCHHCLAWVTGGLTLGWPTKSQGQREGENPETRLRA